MKPRPWCIFLNGTSSAGKSSLAQALQKLFFEPVLHVGVDTFLFTMPEQFLFEGHNAHLGYTFTRRDDHEGAKVFVQNGRYAQTLNRVKRSTMQALLAANFNLIIDEVLYCEQDYHDYRALLSDYPVTYVAVKPPLEVAEARERQRGDRMIGLARGLHDLVHANKEYDFEIDTSQYSPEEAALFLYTHIFVT